MSTEITTRLAAIAQMQDAIAAGSRFDDPRHTIIVAIDEQADREAKLWAYRVWANGTDIFSAGTRFKAAVADYCAKEFYGKTNADENPPTVADIVFKNLHTFRTYLTRHGLDFGDTVVFFVVENTASSTAGARLH